MLSDPKAYEILDPADFGRERTVMMAHRLTGWNIMSERAQQLGLVLSKELLQRAALKIKEMADSKGLDQHDVDHVLRTIGTELSAAELAAANMLPTGLAHA